MMIAVHQEDNLFSNDGRWPQMKQKAMPNVFDHCPQQEPSRSVDHEIEKGQRSTDPK